MTAVFESLLTSSLIALIRLRSGGARGGSGASGGSGGTLSWAVRGSSLGWELN